MRVNGLHLCRRAMERSGLTVGVGGKKHDLVFMALDRLFSKRVSSHVETELGVLQIDRRHGPERLLAFAFESVFRFYAQSPLGILLRDMDPGVFIDIGANLGMYSLLAKDLGWRVHSFEPEPSHAAFLKRNNDLLGTVHKVALSDTMGELPLYYNPRNPGATSLVAADSYERSSEVVPVSTFSDFYDEGGLGDLQGVGVLVKVDVEGLEANVVRGMVPALDNGLPRATLWVEVRGDAAGRSPGSFRDVCDMLLVRGFVPLDPETRMPVEEVENYGRARETFDLLFARRP